MAKVSFRNVENKSGVVYDSGSLTRIYAEDYLLIKHSLEQAGSEVLIKVVNLSTMDRDNHVVAGSIIGSGVIVYNTTVGSLQFYDGTWHNLTDNYLVQGILPIGSIPNLSGTYSIVSHNHNGSYLPIGVLPVGSIPPLNYIPHGVLAVGSIPNLSSTYSLVTHAHNGSYLPQGILPVGSIPSLSSTYSGVTHAHTGSYLPQGILPVGSIPSLSGTYSLITHNHTGSYLPQGQLPTGSLPNNISIIGSMTAGSYYGYGGGLTGLSSGVTDHGALTGLSDDDHLQYLLINGLRAGSNLQLVGSLIVGSVNGTNGSFTSTLVASNLSGNNTGDQTLVGLGGLPQGQLPTGSIPDLSATYSLITHAHTGSYLPHGQLPTGSLPNDITVSGTISAGSFIGYGGNLTGLTTGVTDHGALTGLSDDDHTQYLLINGTRTGSNLILTGSIIAGSINGINGSFSGTLIANNLSGDNTGDQTLAGLNGLPQGILPVGSIPSLSSTYSLVTHSHVGSYLPLGVLPIGSIPDLSSNYSVTTHNHTGSYLPLGVLPLGSLPLTGSVTTIQFNDVSLGSGDSNFTWNKTGSRLLIAGSTVTTYGSVTTKMYAGSYYGYGATLTNVLPQGVLPVGSIPALSYSALTHNHTGSYLPQGQLPTGSLPNYITVAGSLLGSIVAYDHPSGAGSHTPMVVNVIYSSVGSPAANTVPEGTIFVMYTA